MTIMLKLIKGVVNSGKTMVLIHYIAEALANTENSICVFLEEYPLEKFKTRLDTYLRFRGIDMDRIIGIEDISDCEPQDVVAKFRTKEDSIVFIDSWNQAITGEYAKFMDVVEKRKLPVYKCDSIDARHEADLIGNSNLIDHIVVWKDTNKIDRIMVKDDTKFALTFDQFYDKHHIASVEATVNQNHVDEPEEGVKLISMEVDDDHCFNFVSMTEGHEYLNKFIDRKVRISIETID